MSNTYQSLERKKKAEDRYFFQFGYETGVMKYLFATKALF